MAVLSNPADQLGHYFLQHPREVDLAFAGAARGSPASPNVLTPGLRRLQQPLSHRDERWWGTRRQRALP